MPVRLRGSCRYNHWNWPAISIPKDRFFGPQLGNPFPWTLFYSSYHIGCLFWAGFLLGPTKMYHIVVSSLKDFQAEGVCQIVHLSLQGWLITIPFQGGWRMICTSRTSVTRTRKKETSWTREHTHRDTQSIISSNMNIIRIIMQWFRTTATISRYPNIWQKALTMRAESDR